MKSSYELQEEENLSQENHPAQNIEHVSGHAPLENAPPQIMDIDPRELYEFEPETNEQDTKAIENLIQKCAPHSKSGGLTLHLLKDLQRYRP